MRKHILGLAAIFVWLGIMFLLSITDPARPEWTTQEADKTDSLLDEVSRKLDTMIDAQRNAMQKTQRMNSHIDSMNRECDKAWRRIEQSPGYRLLKKLEKEERK